MKTKFLFGAMALSAVFVGCNNEELASVEQETNKQANEIVGANLVSKGMSLEVYEPTLESRVTEGGAWEVGKDRLGLAWFNVGANIQASQTANDMKNGGIDDSYIYANHMFTFAGKVDGKNVFQTMSNVYEGAYFLSYPFVYRTSVSKMSIGDVNAETQTTEVDHDMMNKATYLSNKDFIAVGDLDQETGALEKAFYLFPIVNTLQVNATPEASIQENKTLNVLKIQKVEFDAKGLAFRQGLKDLNPNKLTLYVTKTVNGEKVPDYAKMAKNLDDALLSNLGTYSDPVQTVTTNVNVPKYTLANETSKLRMFLLPVDNSFSGVEKPSLTVTVGKTIGEADINLAEFAIKYDIENEEAQNSKITSTLLEVLNGTHKTVNLKKIVRIKDQETNFQPVRAAVDLLLENMSLLTDAITSEAHWNELVKLVDAIYSIDNEYFTDNKVDFTLANDITFDGAVTAPKNVVINLNTNTKKLNVNKNCTWPANIESATVGNIIVKEGVTLTVNNDTKGAAGKLTFSTDPGAVIKVGDKGKVVLKSSSNKGRVVISKYGGKVEGGKNNGVIAFQLPNKYTIQMINNLINQSPKVGVESAYVNMLILDGVKFDVDDSTTDPTVDDPYTGQTGGNTNTIIDAIKNVSFELKNGAELVDFTEILNVTVLQGTKVDENGNPVASQIRGKEATIKGDVTVEDGAKLEIIDGGVQEVTGDITVGVGATLNTDKVVTVGGDLTLEEEAVVVMKEVKTLDNVNMAEASKMDIESAFDNNGNLKDLEVTINTLTITGNSFETTFTANDKVAVEVTTINMSKGTIRGNVK